MKKRLKVNVLLLSFLLSACGGGGGSSNHKNTAALDPPETVDPPYILPPSTPKTYENITAADPLSPFRTVQFPEASKFDYRRVVPETGWPLELRNYINPDTDLPDDLIPMVHRAFKLWSRRIDGLLQPGNNHRASSHREPGTDNKVVLDFSAGYTREIGCEYACASHKGNDNLQPEGRSDSRPVIAVSQDFTQENENSDKLTVNNFGIITHEFGHIFDYKAPSGQGALDRGVYQEYHRNCSTEGIMCQHWQHRTPTTPTDQDFDGIRHHYRLKPNTDVEEFGIWASVRSDNSNLNEFGVKVTRVLIVDPINRFTQEAAEDFITDQIRIETMIEGTTSNGPVMGLGTVSWSGDLIAVDTNHFQPILGDANLNMDLSNVDRLDARFTDMQRTDNVGMKHDIADTAYTLIKSGTTYGNDQGTIDANFYAVGTDNIGAVAGRIDDASRNLIGAYGATRDGIR